MPCEMCGNEAPLKRAVIEGTKMRVCPDCLEYGEEVTEPKQPQSTPSTAGGPGSGGSTGGVQAGSRQPKGTRDVYDETEKILAEDYGEIVRKARDEKGLTAAELSDEINEKRSVVAKTERGDHHPSDELVTKLERFLDIELMEEPEPSQRVSGSSSSSSGGVTLGDLIKDEMEDED